MILSHYRRAGARSRTRKWTCRRARRKAASGTKTQCTDHDLGRPRARETCACRRRGLNRSQRVFLSKAKSKQISTCVSAGGGGTRRAPRVLTLQSAPDCYFGMRDSCPPQENECRTHRDTTRGISKLRLRGGGPARRNICSHVFYGRRARAAISCFIEHRSSLPLHNE